MTVKLLTEHHFGLLSLKGAAQACLSLHVSRYHIVGKHMPQLICDTYHKGVHSILSRACAFIIYPFVGSNGLVSVLCLPYDAVGSPAVCDCFM